MSKTADSGQSKRRKQNEAIPVAADKGKAAATKTQPQTPRTGAESAAASPGATTSEEPRSFQADDDRRAARSEAPGEGRRDMETERQSRNTDIERG